MNARSFYVILNGRSGTAAPYAENPEALEAAFREQGLEADVDVRFDVPLEERIADALASPHQVIVAAGGDGTVTAVAGGLHTADTDKIMAILPLGTANLLAKDLGIPLDLEAGITQLSEMTPHAIDVGEVNGKPFLHKVVIGTIPELAAGREHIRGKPGFAAKIGLARYFIRRLLRARRFAVEIVADGERRIERVQALAVGTNTYGEGFGQFFARPELDQGFLSLYMLKHLTVGDVFKLTALMIIGRWRDYDGLTIKTVQNVTLRSRKRMPHVMFDGEIMLMEMPMEFSIRKRALSILAPVRASQTEAGKDLILESATGH